MDRKPFSEKPELLAPAADLTRVKTAVLYGADAVYVGGERYSLRARASHLTLSEIREACAFAESHHARIHVAVNAVPHEEDFAGLEEYLHALEEAGVTAIIAASPTVMAAARRAAPRLEIHASTQLSITNAAAARFWAEYGGVNRVVLARECTLADIQALVPECPVDTEVFIQGAMCVNISGRCALSNRMTLRDANRGGCAQSCRWSYRLLQQGRDLSRGRRPFTMGSRDLMAAPYLAALMAAGVRSFKIEGRMRTEYYIASVVYAYRQLIDAVFAAKGDLAPGQEQALLDQLARGINRETCPGFLEGEEKAGLILHPHRDEDVNHAFLAKVLSYQEDTRKAWIETRNPFAQGDRVEVLSPHRPLRRFVMPVLVDENGQCVSSSRTPMARFRIAVPFALAPGDILRRCEP
jgi:putative protease